MGVPVAVLAIVVGACSSGSGGQFAGTLPPSITCAAAGGCPSPVRTAPLPTSQAPAVEATAQAGADAVADAGDDGLSCRLEGGCSLTEPPVCIGDVAGCAVSLANCQPQCLNGTWQNPCPADVPQSGSACAAAGAYCGYSDQPNPCGADNCYCERGVWTCGPTCVIDASVSLQDAADANVDLDAGSFVDAAPPGFCVSKTCAQLGFTCGVNSDGCGNVIQCGTCMGSDFCGGGGPSVCGDGGL
jgi:hypothetical protein